MKRLTYVFAIVAMLLGLTNGVKAQQSWSFSSVSTTDQKNLNADATNWTYESSNNRWLQQAVITDAALTANGVELEFTKGLTFTTTDKDQIRVDNKKGCLTLNNKLAKLTIHNVKAGQQLTVDCQSSNSKTARTITATNVTTTSGFKESTSRTTNVATVKADGIIEIQSTGGMYVYSISVTTPGENPQPEEPAGDDLSVAQSSIKSQAVLTLSDQTKRYYNTADLASIDIDGTNVKVNKGNNSYTFANKVTDISFTKGVPMEEGDEGAYTNPTGKVEISEAKGWLESAYVKFKLFEGATSYNVYVKGGQFTDYTKIDAQLVRNYGTYGRADMVGLTAGDYAMKVVPTNAEGAEMTDAANEATRLIVKNYDRTGYAHFNYSGVGAYNNDGSLKSNARVLYVTKNNFNTVTLDMVTDNKGKVETFTGLGEIFLAKQKGYDTKPIAVRVVGEIRLADVNSGQLKSDQNGLQLKGNKAETLMDVTIEGIGEDAAFNGFGITFYNGTSVEMRNIGLMNFNDDGVQLKGTQRAWIHHVDIFYGKPGSDADQKKGDGSLDMKDDSKYCTFAYIHFWDSGKSSLCGMKSESGENWMTFHHNWYDHSDSRHPRVRTMTVHVYNNYYDGISKYGVGATTGSSVFVERNYFRNAKFPMMISLQGNDVYAGSSNYNPGSYGTFSGEEGGMIKSFDNYITGSTSSYWPYGATSMLTKGKMVTASSLGVDTNVHFDCYEVADKSEQVPASIKSFSGNNTYNNFDTNPSLIYDYTADAVGNVPAIVMGYYGAGRLNHGDLQWEFNDEADDTDYEISSGLQSLVLGYQTTLVGIFGDENSSGGGEQGGGEQGGGEQGGGEQGGGSEVPEGTITASFNGFPSNSMFTVATGSSYGDGNITYNGTSYKKGVKLDSKGSITFTPTKNYNMTIVMGTAKDGRDVKINGTATTVSGTENTTGKYYQLEPIAITANTQYVITKGNKEGLVMLIILEPRE